MKVATVTLSSGQVVPLRGFNILVGANNVGKSQSLRDIHTRMAQGPDAKTVLVAEIAAPKPDSIEQALAGLDVRPDPNHAGRKLVGGINANLRGGERISVDLDQLVRQLHNAEDGSFLLPTLGRFRVAYLDAASRLQVAQATKSINAHDQVPERLLQALFTSGRQMEHKLREAFIQTFAMDVRLDYSALTQLCLRIAPEFDEIPPDPREALPIMGQYQQLDAQGDGFRSFVGVVLSLLMSEGRLILLDEPEAFLHPAQARMLGAWVANQSQLGDNQLVVATHNAHFLRGVLDSGVEVGIFRLNRTGNVTEFVEMPAAAVTALTKSPLLSSQGVLEAVFHKGVVVSEADSDRSVYHLVATRDLASREVLFIHAHNKQTIHEVIELLRLASIPAAAVVDIDLMNSAHDLDRLLDALVAPDKAPLMHLREVVAEAIEGAGDEEILASIRADVEELLGQMTAGEHSASGARSALRRIDASGSLWKDLKLYGLEALEGAARAAAEELIQRLAALGLFVVPVGELEGWIDVGTRQKKKWIVAALTVVDEEGAPEELRQFVGRILKSLGEVRVAGELEAVEMA